MELDKLAIGLCSRQNEKWLTELWLTKKFFFVNQQEKTEKKLWYVKQYEEIHLLSHGPKDSRWQDDILGDNIVQLTFYLSHFKNAVKTQGF